MNAELEEEHGLPLRSYDVLRQLALAPEGRLRMAELADRVLLTRPGLTGAVRRLEEEGLVRRAPTPEDGRGAIACLTADGERRLDEVQATHLGSIRRSFIDRLSEDEIEVLGRIWARIRRAESPADGADVLAIETEAPTAAGYASKDSQCE